MLLSMNSRSYGKRSRHVAASLKSIVDTIRFFGTWLRDPRGVAAVAPSGRALSALITRDIRPGMGPVLELGPGTGAFTQALLDNGIADRELTLVEFDAPFARLLRQRYARATILEMDAADLAQADIAPGDGFGATICGLGLLNMPDAKVEAILCAAFARMRPGAPLFLFTYGRRCSVSRAALHRLGLSAERVGTAWRNLPPATVYRLSRRAGHAR